MTDSASAALEVLIERTIARVRGLRPAQIVEKAPVDYVSDVDHHLDELLTEGLRAVRDVAVFSEERPFPKEAFPDAFWIIDPLDGTHNFLAGVPHSAICAALFEGGDVTLSAVGDLGRGDVYSAARGRGARLNGGPVRPSDAGTLIGVSTGAMDALAGRPDCYAALRSLGKFRNLGSQALHLCYVARGALAMAASAEARIWDDAAARLVAEEAGAHYRSFAKAPWTLAHAGEPQLSLCAHAAVFERASALFAELWE